MQLIGLNGFKQSGKGTTANLIQELVEEKLLDLPVKQVGFADKLKVIAARSLGYSGSDAELIDLMDQFKLNGHVESFVSLSEANKVRFKGTGQGSVITGRMFLQNLGNDARQVFGDTFWIDQVLPKPCQHPSRDNRLVENMTNLVDMHGVGWLLITDLRYPNEAERVLALGGEVWEIVRPGLESDGHASEQPLPRELVSQTIDNDGDVMELRYKVEKALGL